MPILVGRYFECKIWRRGVNTNVYESTPIIFRAKVVSDDQNQSEQMLQGLLQESHNLVIETVDLEEVGIYDKVEILEEQYQVQRVITKKQNSPYTLGANKLNAKFLKGKLPKVIYLI